MFREVRGPGEIACKSNLQHCHSSSSTIIQLILQTDATSGWLSFRCELIASDRSLLPTTSASRFLRENFPNWHIANHNLIGWRLSPPPTTPQNHNRHTFRYSVRLPWTVARPSIGTTTSKRFRKPCWCFSVRRLARHGRTLCWIAAIGRSLWSATPDRTTQTTTDAVPASPSPTSFPFMCCALSSSSTCSWPSSWTTSITWPGTGVFWVRIIWTSSSACGANTIRMPREGSNTWTW